MNLDSKKLRLVLLGSIVILVLAFVGTAALGLSMLGSKSKAMVSQKVKSQTANNELANLEVSKKEVEKYSYFKDIAKAVIPNDKNQAEAVVAIFQIADQSGISIQSITFPVSTLGLSLATPQDATSTSATTGALSQAKPVANIPGLYSLELTITPASGIQAAPDKQITFAKMLDFLNRIENNQRTAQITQVNIQPAGANQTFSFTLTVNIFIKP